MSDYDRRLVDLYDDDNPDGPDHDFYRDLADRVGARAVLDLGCGTGILTVTLARGGRRVVGVDPSESMLDVARHRPGRDDVEWVLGDSREIPDGPFDLAVITGNAVQHIPDPDWERSLGDLRRAIRTGGVLAFETRNPAARAWEDWSSETERLTVHGRLRERTDAEETEPGVVELTSRNVFVDTGEHVVERQTLVFRDVATLVAQLDEAGFRVDELDGGWDRAPFSPDDRLIVVVASAV